MLPESENIERVNLEERPNSQHITLVDVVMLGQTLQLLLVRRPLTCDFINNYPLKLVLPQNNYDVGLLKDQHMAAFKTTINNSNK